MAMRRYDFEFSEGENNRVTPRIPNPWNLSEQQFQSGYRVEGEEEIEEEEEEQEDEEEYEDENEEEPENARMEEDVSCEDLRSTRITSLVFITRGKRKELDTESNAISVTLTAPDVLDCPICLEPLSTPVFQCANGHTACSSCCSKIRNECPSCSLSIGYNRCRAMEKLLESIRISCKNMKYGCKETLSYSKKHDHEQTCVYEPCSCPHPDCNYVDSSEHLYFHFNYKHPSFAVPFSWDKIFSFTIRTDVKFVIFQERVDNTLFVLNYGVQRIGDVANITCIAPSLYQNGFRYELMARKGVSSVKLESFTESMPRWSEHLPQKTFLLVPKDFIGCSKTQNYHICIRRHEEVPHQAPKT